MNKVRAQQPLQRVTNSLHDFPHCPSVRTTGRWPKHQEPRTINIDTRSSGIELQFYLFHLTRASQSNFPIHHPCVFLTLEILPYTLSQKNGLHFSGHPRRSDLSKKLQVTRQSRNRPRTAPKINWSLPGASDQFIKQTSKRVYREK